MALLAIIFLGSVQYIVLSRWEIEKGARFQMAWMAMSSQLERALHLGYGALQDSLPETSTPVTLNGIQGYRTTVVTPIDDPLDGVSPGDTTVPDYLEVKVNFSWFTPGNPKDSVSVHFSPERSGES